MFGLGKGRTIPPFVVGLLVPIAYSNVGHLLGMWYSAWLLLLLIALYVAVGAYIWRGTFKASVIPLLKVLLAVPVAVFIDVNIDWFFRKFDRNLFPFEIVFLWIVAPFLLLIGMGIRKLLPRSLNVEVQQISGPMINLQRRLEAMSFPWAGV